MEQADHAKPCSLSDMKPSTTQGFPVQFKFKTWCLIINKISNVKNILWRARLTLP